MKTNNCETFCFTLITMILYNEKKNFTELRQKCI